LSQASQVSYAPRVKALLLCVGGLAACAISQAPPVPPRQSTISLEVRNATLQNGLRVVLVRDPRAADIQVTMQYRVGNIHDPVGQEGMAHLVEHLMFEQVLGAESLYARLENATTTFNATTREEVTTYTARARPERLDELLSIEAVRVGYRCTSITHSAFTREREVVLQELREKDTASDLYAAINGSVFPEGHPYHRTATDTVESVSKITLAQACSFADTHYTTTNAVLVVSGNITPQRLDEGLNKFLGRIQKRETQGFPIAIPDSGLGRRVTVDAPLDQEALLFTWPLPRDPGDRLKVRTVARVVEAYIDDVIRGSTVRFEVGDEQARTLCIAVLPRGPQGDIVATVTEKLASLDSLPDEAKASPSDQIIFGMMHQDALYRVFAGYEDGSDRDDALAIGFHAGRDPDAAIADASATLRALTFDEALRVLRRHLNTRRMSVVMMKPREGTKHGVPAKVEAPVHDIGERRAPPDPEEAKRPETDVTAIPALGAKRELVLPNGLKVVLLPVTSVPTVEVRLVLHTGTADDPVDRRGAAMVAARGLGWPRGYFTDLLNFTSAGARGVVEVTDDTTAFVARGLDMHVDFLLTGLARWIREGSYNGKMLRALRALAPGDEADLQDAWRAALYGPQHPYTRGGLARHIDAALTMDDVLAFHVKHYTPANATIVIAGKFDAGLAQKWIEYLFGDWEGAP
jgi:zinc protease